MSERPGGPHGPAISVVVSSYERPEGLGRLLSALAAQTLPRHAFEVIVVDNGSGPATAAVLADAVTRLDLELRTVRLPVTRGPAGGRNAGWRIARAALVAFTDDDCVPRSDWLERLLDAAARTDRPGFEVLQGATVPAPADLADLRNTLRARIVRVSAADGRYETCNIVYPHRLLTLLDGFDETFVPRGVHARPVGEDTDLGFRSRRRGATVRFVPDAVVEHAVTRLGWLEAIVHGTRWGGAVHLFKVHPAAREFLFRGIFWNVWHYLGLRALLALWAPPWLRRVLLGRYLRALALRAAECGVGAWAVPYLIAQDATEAGALLAASIRERTLVL